MSPLNRAQLETEVGRVLAKAARGKGRVPRYLTAYQILERLPAPLRAALVAHYSKPGAGARAYYSAASRVASIAGRVGAWAYLDTRGISFDHDQTAVRAGYQLARIYRAKSRSSP